MNRTLSNFPMQIVDQQLCFNLDWSLQLQFDMFVWLQKLSPSIFKLFVEKAVKFSEE